jgi:hypothetical protein
MTKARFTVLAALLLAATPTAAIPPSSVTDTRDPATRAAYCAAFLYNDVRNVPSADRPRAAAALNAWRADLRRQRRAQGDAARYFETALAATDNNSLDSRIAAAAYCESHAPLRRRR